MTNSFNNSDNNVNASSALNGSTTNDDELQFIIASIAISTIALLCSSIRLYLTLRTSMRVYIKWLLVFRLASNTMLAFCFVILFVGVLVRWDQNAMLCALNLLCIFIWTIACFMADTLTLFGSCEVIWTMKIYNRCFHAQIKVSVRKGIILLYIYVYVYICIPFRCYKYLNCFFFIGLGGGRKIVLMIPSFNTLFLM